MTDEPAYVDALWYLARGTGVVCLVLLTIVVVLGVGSRSGRPLFGLPRFAVSTVHRNASVMALGLLVVHMTSLYFDPYAQLRLVDLLVPFDAAYRPLWLGLGTLAADLVFVLMATSLLRRHLGVRTWRAVHWIAYAVWPAAWLHALGTGTDAGQLWLRVLAGVCIAVFLAAVGWRSTEHFGELASRSSKRRGELASRSSKRRGELASRSSKRRGELASRSSKRRGELASRTSERRGEASRRVALPFARADRPQ